MKLSEKILYCRKKCGYSQEDLAQTLGISRQAVSKWETGESEPEVDKLKLLADTFNVTTDWLLSEEAPKDKQEANKQQPDCYREQDLYRNLPGFIGRFFRKHGWISGLIILAQGVFITLIGLIARIAVRGMFADSLWSEEMTSHNPVYMMSAVFIAIGAVFMIGGGILAVYLKHRFHSDK